MDMDRAYANGAFIAGGDAYPARWAAQARAFRTAMGSRATLGLACGPAERQRLDLFRPLEAARGTVVFLHGGYWMAFDRSSWSHLAAGAVARGWAVAMPSYTLAPQARIPAMTAEIAAALGAVAAQTPGPVVVTGHSAGGHLAARMACADVLDAGLAARVVRSVPISPLADLAPLRATKMNETLRLTGAEVAAESPALLPRRPGCGVTVWVGGQERPAFLWQARLLSEAWDCPWHVAPGRHHFDVIDDLADPDSLLVETLVGGF
ncbi:MAG: alpha/beta hydrolase [Rhodobacter sp.]|nr:alpha/beta hydrolase [Rhodobacter sp.]